MKVRESGMPDEKMWNDFFDIDSILSEMQINNQVNDIAEIGCGYGTFTIPAAKQINSRVFAFDIEKELIDILDIRPKPDQILSWIDRRMFTIHKEPFIIEPYYFGLILSKL